MMAQGIVAAQIQELQSQQLLQGTAAVGLQPSSPGPASSAAAAVSNRNTIDKKIKSGKASASVSGHNDEVLWDKYQRRVRAETLKRLADEGLISRSSQKVCCED